MILSDNETKVDFLNNEPIAKTIVALLRERPNHPITVAALRMTARTSDGKGEGTSRFLRSAPE
jgi:hypothetical protein